ncbi:MAG: exodeoxyribonuclease [Frankiales bacterium]|nr:exodeoxyribonuclease [Frankiales bacterium]
MNGVRIATWNVNSVKSRLPRLLPWLADRSPDVLLLQETKGTDEAWPAPVFSALGYESAHLGDGRWNGVAVLSKVGLENVTLGLPGQPAFEGVQEPRALGVSCGGLRLWSLYVPNGRKAGSPHYHYKLAFLDALRAHAALEAQALSGAPLGLLGDFNVAPHDADVWDITAFDGGTHVSVAEREALQALRLGLGLQDLVPRASHSADDTRHPFTFWEMRMLGYQKGRGMRLDLALVNPALRARVSDCWVDRDARKGAGPSDHAPLVVDLD